MKRIRKFPALLLAFSLLLAMFLTACGQTATGDPTDSVGDTASDTTSDAPGAGA